MASKSNKCKLGSPRNTEDTTPVGKKSKQHVTPQTRLEPPRTRSNRRSFFNIGRRQLAESLVPDEDSDSDSVFITPDKAADMPADSSPAKPNPPTAEDFRNILRESLADVTKKEDLDKVMQKVDQNTNAITAMNLRMTNIEGQISSNNNRQDEKLIEFEDRLSRTHSTPSLRSSREAAYDKARRSLRVWPIEGEDTNELRKNFKDFAINALLIAQDTVDNTNILEIIRVRNSPSARVYLEASVTFETVEERDFFNPRARNLADYRDKEGKPEAGIRMDIPPSCYPPSRSSMTMDMTSVMFMEKRLNAMLNSMRNNSPSSWRLGSLILANGYK